MREIKFRAWDGKYKEMVNDIHIAPEYDWLVLSDNDALAERDNRNRTKKEEYILMQFTGLKDKNGKEIYEGDIVKAEGVTMRDFVGVVEYSVANANFLYAAICGIEVIGNIYENPDLLK